MWKVSKYQKLPYQKILRIWTLFTQWDLDTNWECKIYLRYDVRYSAGLLLKLPATAVELRFRRGLSLVFKPGFTKLPFLKSSVYQLVNCNVFPRFTYQARGGSRAAATSKMERFVIIVNGWKSLTVITKCSILDVAAALDPPLQAWDLIRAR